jgi:hypothetical protein
VQHPPAWKPRRRGLSGPGAEIRHLEPPAIGQKGHPERFDSSKPLPLSLREVVGENRSQRSRQWCGKTVRHPIYACKLIPEPSPLVQDAVEVDGQIANE